MQIKKNPEIPGFCVSKSRGLRTDHKRVKKIETESVFLFCYADNNMGYNLSLLFCNADNSEVKQACLVDDTQEFKN